jgi:NADH:ubiquinone oxidoreductase subunit 6 (subunit J)
MWSRFRALPRPIRAVAVLILFLFALDMFDDGLETVWFQWPAAGLALFALLWLSLVGHRTRP